MAITKQELKSENKLIDTAGHMKCHTLHHQCCQFLHKIIILGGRTKRRNMRALIG